MVLCEENFPFGPLLFWIQEEVMQLAELEQTTASFLGTVNFRPAGPHLGSEILLQIKHFKPSVEAASKSSGEVHVARCFS